MSVDASTLLFFDASCLIAAAGSPTGGSSLLLALCAPGLLRAAVSPPVLAEAEGNVLSNLSDTALKRYRQQILTLPLVMAPVPSPTERERAIPITGDKDAHVLAAALSVEAPFLIALDRPLIERVNQAKLSIQALTPGDFIKSKLPSHPAYRTIR